MDLRERRCIVLHVARLPITIQDSLSDLAVREPSTLLLGHCTLESELDTLPILAEQRPVAAGRSLGQRGCSLSCGQAGYDVWIHSGTLVHRADVSNHDIAPIKEINWCTTFILAQRHLQQPAG